MDDRERIARLERANRRLWWAVAMQALALGGAVGLGAAQGQPRTAKFEVVRAQRFDLVDKQGHERGGLWPSRDAAEVFLTDGEGARRVELHAPGDPKGAAWVKVYGAGERDRVKIVAQGDAEPEVLINPMEMRPIRIYPPR